MTYYIDFELDRLIRSVMTIIIYIIGILTANFNAELGMRIVEVGMSFIVISILREVIIKRKIMKILKEQEKNDK